LDPETGSIAIDGWPVAIGPALTESDAERLVGAGCLKRLAGVVPPDAVYEAPTVSIGGREVGLSLVFRSRVLVSAGLSIAGTEFWTRSAHEQNVALLRGLFPSARSRSKNLTEARLSGARAQAEFVARAGALADGGASLRIRYGAE
jgi:hypothetical protein